MAKYNEDIQLTIDQLEFMNKQEGQLLKTEFNIKRCHAIMKKKQMLYAELDGQLAQSKVGEPKGQGIAAVIPDAKSALAEAAAKLLKGEEDD